MSTSASNRRLSVRRKPTRISNYTDDLFLPKPWRNHRHDIIHNRIRKHMNTDGDDRQAVYSTLDQRLKTVPFGCLSFHILEMLNLSKSVSAFETSVPIFYYCIIRIGRIERISKYVQSPTPTRVRMDAVFLLSLELSEWRSNYRNRLKVEVWAFQDPADHYIIGSAKIHLFEMIRLVHGIEKHYIWGEGALRGKIIYEYAFSYGAFGFGHSNQFRNSEIPVHEAVSQSMFPRIRPADGDVVEPVSQTVLPSKLWSMDLESCIVEERKSKEAAEKYGEHHIENEPFPAAVDLYQVQFQNGRPVHCKVQMPIYQKEFEADFNTNYGEYLCLSTREERISYLAKLVTGRRQDVKETEYAAPLLLPLKDEDLEEAFQAADLGLSSYPSEFRCSLNHKAQIFPTDEKLLDSFPKVDRSPGYLSVLFGYSKRSKDDAKPDFPIQDLQKKVRHHKSQVNVRLWIRYISSKFVSAFRYMKRIIFAETTFLRPGVPQISVTLPSPAMSTSDLHAIWIQDDVKPLVFREDLILQQEAGNYGLPPHLGPEMSMMNPNESRHIKQFGRQKLKPRK